MDTRSPISRHFGGFERFLVVENSPNVGGLEADKLLLRLNHALAAHDSWRNHLVLGSEQAFYNDPRFVLRLISDSFDLRSFDEWEDSQQTLRDIFRLFFDPCSTRPAWVSVIPIRMPFGLRARSSAVSERLGKVKRGVLGSRVCSASVELGSHIGTLPLSGLRFATHPDCSWEDVRLTILNRHRTLRSDRNYRGSDRLIFLSAECDDLSGCRIPAMAAQYDHRLGTDTTRSFLLTKVAAQDPWTVTNLSIALAPTGAVAGVGVGRRPFEMFLRQFDMESELLFKAAAQAPHG